MTKKYKKKLIEVAIPLEAINKASAREKSIRHGHPSTLHLWWARRPLATCRAILFAQLVDDPSSHPDKFPTEESQEQERQRLFKIIEELVIWENSTNEEVLERARAEIRKSCDGELPPVYDPFSGGGSIPLEAQRLGLPAFGSDLNPVAVMIGKAMIEIPPKFKDMKPIHPGGPEQLHYQSAQGLAEDVKYYGKWMRDLAFKRIGHLYPQVDLPPKYGGNRTNVVAWLWARTVPSPNPAFEHVDVPLLTTFILSSRKGNEFYLEPIIENGTYSFQVIEGIPSSIDKYKKGTKVSQGSFRCIISDDVIKYEYVDKMAAIGKMRATLLAVVAEGKRRKVYLDAPAMNVEEPKPVWEFNIKCKGTFASNAMGRRYGFVSMSDYFSRRQLIALTTFSSIVDETIHKIKSDCGALMSTSERDAYADAIAIYLAFCIDKCADYWSTITTWIPQLGALRNTFARQGIAMTWDFAEANPFSNSTGNFMSMLNWVQKVINQLPAKGYGSIIQHDARTVTYPDNAVISTDPPYYGNIGYADLSDFFYVWMKTSIGRYHNEIFGTILSPKENELIADPYRKGGKNEADEYFLYGMKEVMSNIQRQHKSKFPISIYYAFKQKEIEKEGVASTGWATFLAALIESGLSIEMTWPVRTEFSNRPVAQGRNALATSVVLVCRNRDVDADTVTRAEFILALKRELPPALHELQKANITPVDMPQASIGPGIGIFSRYKTVLESDDSPMTVRTALQIINRELDAFLTEQEGEFDSDTRFAVTWFEQNGMQAGDFGDADNLARARGLSVDSVKHAGIVESAAGKVRLLARDELEDDWTPANDTHLTVWECTQYLIRALQDEGEYAAAVLLKGIGPEMADAARDLAYRLFDICDKQGQAKEASAYNSLIAIWSDLTAQAATISDTELGQEQLSML